RGDPTAHAELEALRQAAATRGLWRLDDTVLFVTLEPCAMCAGALVNARVGELVFGAWDPRAGAVETLYGICTDPRLNHRLVVRGGILEEPCRELLQAFFRAKRERKRQRREASRGERSPRGVARRPRERWPSGPRGTPGRRVG